MDPARRTARRTGSACLLVAAPALAQTRNPYPEPVEADDGVIAVGVAELTTLPDVDGEPARTMTLRHEPGTDRTRRADLRMGTAPGGRIFLLNKADGTARGLPRGRRQPSRRGVGLPKSIA